MAQQWRILVVEGDEALNRSIVATLAQDGYSVQGVATGGEAIKILWANEPHLMIGDRALPDADGFDLLQWIRSYRPKTRMMMLATPGSSGRRTRALEQGAVAYFEKPIDLLLLKVEVRRLLQQTGFTANLDSFDLLDVIQIINMSRKSIALVVHTGLEEQGMLGFQEGEMIWAEYGTLRGEEAFFALAAYKNGMVTQQPWNNVARPNVNQPLSRLIMQALQYRAKYEAAQQVSGEHKVFDKPFTMQGDSEGASPLDALLTEAPDDRPFVFVAENDGDASQGEPATPMQPAASMASSAPQAAAQDEPRPWWQESAKVPRALRPTPTENASATKSNGSTAQETPRAGVEKMVEGTSAENAAILTNGSSGVSITPSTVRKTPTGQRSDLPSWLMDQPTQFEVQAVRPSALKGSGQIPVTPLTPTARPAQSSSTPRKTDELRREQAVSASVTVNASNSARPALTALMTPTPASATFGEVVVAPAKMPVNFPFAASATQQVREQPKQAQPPRKRNYAALVSALETVGYALPGFIAAALVGLDGQPIAQVATDDLDITGICATLSALLQGAVRALDTGVFGQHEDTIIT
ncbi:MAG TPA: response regulator, partial [Ktedonobacteraceae bacterium]|nr:response regulator [Ktedonobacteraceae bacterium]